MFAFNKKRIIQKNDYPSGIKKNRPLPNCRISLKHFNMTSIFSAQFNFSARSLEDCETPELSRNANGDRCVPLSVMTRWKSPTREKTKDADLHLLRRRFHAPKIITREESPLMSQYSIFIHFNKPGPTVMSFPWVQGSLLYMAFALVASYTTHLACHTHLTQISHLRRFARGMFSFLLWSCSHFLRPLNSRGHFWWFCIGLENTFPVFSLKRSYYTGFAYPTQSPLCSLSYIVLLHIGAL